MKKSALFSSLLAVTVILSNGCTKSQSAKDDLNKKLVEINQQNEELMNDVDRTLQDTLKTTTQGGQPGTVTLNGILSIDNDKLDSRITLSQSAGLNRDGSSATTMAQGLTKLNTLKSEDLEKLKADFKKREEERTYINLGCELAESEVAGLTDATVKIDITKDMVLSATRIFICGELNISDKILLSLSASEIMLKDASITQQKNLGTLSITTRTLILAGKNKITSLGENGAGLLLSASSISLTVTNEIYGDGELALKSKGANNIAEQKQDEK